jgi:tetratricopeptide (TPR) repeat protein
VASRARLLLEDEHTYQFAHDLIREVVEADIGAARRLVLHRRIAEALEAAPGERAVEALAYHYGRAGVLEKAALYLEQAGDRAWAQHAATAAERSYREVVERWDHLGHPHESARVREKVGLVLLTTAQLGAALQVLETAAATYRAAHDDEGLARVTARIGRLHEDRGTPAEGVQRLQPLVERLEARGPSPGLVTLYARLADLLWACGQYRAQLAAAQRALDLARRVGDDYSLAEALWEQGLARLTAGHLAEARRALEEAVPRAEAVGALDSQLEPLLLLSVIFLRSGAVERSRRTCTHALALAEHCGFAAYVATATARLAILAFVLGEWAQARRYGDAALAVSRALGPSWVSPRPLTALGLLCLGEGRQDAARTYLEDSVAVAARVGQQPAEPYAPSLLAECDLLAGQPVRARRRLEPLVDAARQSGVDVALLLTPLAWAHLDLGDVAAAAALLGEVTATARAQNDSLVLVDALRVQAMVATRQGQGEAAAALVEEGLALARGMPYPYAEGRLLHVSGALHSAQREPARARERLEGAVAIFRRLGASKDMERARQALAALSAIST